MSPVMLPKLDRRAFLAGAVLAGTWRCAWGGPIPPRSLEAFVDSIGVNTHLTSEPYQSRFDKVVELLAAAGIRHLRDELRPSDDLDRWRRLRAAAGIKAHLLVSPATNSVPEMLDYIRNLGPDGISAIEGQNEGDSDWFRAQPAARPTWNEAVVTYQLAVCAALRREPTMRDLPILSPSVLDYKPSDMLLLRRAAPVCDVVAIHSYVQHGQEPETTEDYAALGWYLRHMRDAFKPGAPAMATETGYRTLASPGDGGISEAAAAIYIPRLLLNNFSAGIGRTFLYEFMDGGTDPSDGEQHWGLVHHDGTPKPAYDAVRALIWALAGERGAVQSAAPIGTAPDGNDPDLRILALSRPDGGRVYAVWRAVRCWCPSSGTDLAPEIRRQRLTLDRPAARLQSLVLDGGRTWTEHGPGSDIVLPLGGTVTLLRPS